MNHRIIMATPKIVLLLFNIFATGFSWCPLNTRKIEYDVGCDICECCRTFNGDYFINCSNRSLSTVPAISSDATELDLTSNQITSLTKQSFPSFLPSLTTLSIGEFVDINFYREWYDRTQQLIRFPPIRIITADVFENIPNLKNLSLAIGFHDVTDFMKPWNLTYLRLRCQRSFHFASQEYEVLFRTVSVDYLELLGCRAENLTRELFRRAPKHLKADPTYDSNDAAMTSYMPAIGLPNTRIEIKLTGSSFAPSRWGHVVADDIFINCATQNMDNSCIENDWGWSWIYETTARVHIRLYDAKNFFKFGCIVHSLEYYFRPYFTTRGELEYGKENPENVLIRGMSKEKLRVKHLTLSSSYNFPEYSSLGNNFLDQLVAPEMTELSLKQFRLGWINNFDFNLTSFTCTGCQFDCYDCFEAPTLRKLNISSADAVIRNIDLQDMLEQHPSLEVLILRTRILTTTSPPSSNIERKYRVLDHPIRHIELYSETQVPWNHLTNEPITLNGFRLMNLFNLERLVIRNMPFLIIRAREHGESPSIECHLYYPLSVNWTSLVYLELSGPYTESYWTSYIHSAFTGMDSLKELHIRDIPYWADTNRLKPILVNVSKTLVTLTLTDQGLISIGSDLFRGMSNLRHLDLSRNIIESLAPGAFQDLSSLRFLLLSRNKLRTLDGGMYSRTLALTKLALDNNKVEEIDDKVVQQLSKLPYLREVNFAANRFRCSCENRKLRDWINVQRNKKRIFINYNGVCPQSAFLELGILFTEYSLPWTDCDFYKEGLIIGCVLVALLLVLVALYLAWYYRYDLLFWWVVKRRHRLNRRHHVHPERQFHAFLSYSSSEQLVAEYIFFQLEDGQDVKFKIAYDCRDFLPLYDIAENIIRCIDRSEKVIFLISSQFLEREWTMFELNFAQMRSFDERKNLIILIFMEKFKTNDLPKRIQILRRQVNYLEYPDHADRRAVQNFWHRLRLALAEDSEIETDPQACEQRQSDMLL